MYSNILAIQNVIFHKTLFIDTVGQIIYTLYMSCEYFINSQPQSFDYFLSLLLWTNVTEGSSFTVYRWVVGVIIMIMLTWAGWWYNLNNRHTGIDLITNNCWYWLLDFYREYLSIFNEIHVCRRYQKYPDNQPYKETSQTTTT